MIRSVSYGASSGPSGQDQSPAYAAALLQARLEQAPSPKAPARRALDPEASAIVGELDVLRELLGEVPSPRTPNELREGLATVARLLAAYALTMEKRLLDEAVPVRIARRDLARLRELVRADASYGSSAEAADARSALLDSLVDPTDGCEG